jgi:HTH-type transcriptional regulator/antitoxin HipB
MDRFVPPIPLTALSMPRLVRDGRELAGLTQAALGARAGVGRDRIARVEGGHGGAKLRDLDAILAALDAAGVILRPDGRPDLRDAPRWSSG